MESFANMKSKFNIIDISVNMIDFEHIQKLQDIVNSKFSYLDIWLISVDEYHDGYGSFAIISLFFKDIILEIDEYADLTSRILNDTRDSVQTYNEIYGAEVKLGDLHFSFDPG